jgi:hypothetical protein
MSISACHTARRQQNNPCPLVNPIPGFRRANKTFQRSLLILHQFNRRCFGDVLIAPVNHRAGISDSGYDPAQPIFL